MSVIFIRKLIWDSWNIKHIAHHDVTPEEVEATCHNEPLILRGQQKNRLVIIGTTEEDRIIAVILESQGRGVYYPVTAYPAGANDKALYKRLKNKGGENKNEEK